MEQRAREEAAEEDFSLSAPTQTDVKSCPLHPGTISVEKVPPAVFLTAAHEPPTAQTSFELPEMSLYTGLAITALGTADAIIENRSLEAGADSPQAARELGHQTGEKGRTRPVPAGSNRPGGLTMRGPAMAGALLAGLAMLLAGCRGAGNAVADAALNTAIAATYSGVRRANGECYSP
ncbi:MAG TPA: hypothetical protein DFS52_15480, partial [Myxococcales bacterium]|nr:hypothetical protein [Myxococcales bacterium]